MIAASSIVPAGMGRIVYRAHRHLYHVDQARDSAEDQAGDCYPWMMQPGSQPRASQPADKRRAGQDERNLDHLLRLHKGADQAGVSAGALARLLRVRNGRVVGHPWWLYTMHGR